MHKCRLCLKNRKRVLPIYGCENGTTFCAMITSIAKVKIDLNDGLTNQICLSCCRKLREAYEFKLNIERCDEILQESSNFRKINFDNFAEIKIKIEHDYKPIIPKIEDFAGNIFKHGEDQMSYNDTYITKVNPDYQEEGSNGLVASGSVMELFSTFKADLYDDMDTCNDYRSDAEEYNPHADSDYNVPLALRKRKKKFKAKKRMKKDASNKENKIESVARCFTPIKPIYMKDLKVIPAKCKRRDTSKSEKPKHNYKKKSVCPYCGKLCAALDIHILQHTGEKKYTCEKCPKSFFTAAGFKVHSYKHDSPKSYKCEQCTASFFCASGLRSHMRMHTTERNHICHMCSKGFKRKGALNRHMLRHNLAGKSFKCDLCNMSFHEIFGLKHHMRVHTGERPYKCEICSQPYSYKHDFNRHCFKKHGVFLKRRSVYVMNEEVLKKEQALMKDLMLRAHGIVKEGEPLNPFEGPQAAQAFQMAIKAIENKQIPLDFQV